MEQVYLIKKGGLVIPHRDLAAMEQLDGIAEPEKTVTVEEWEAAGSTAHIDGSGEIILGISPEEKERREKEERRTVIVQSLDDIDVKSVRSARAVATALANDREPDEEDVSRLNQWEDQATELRRELVAL